MDLPSPPASSSSALFLLHVTTLKSLLPFSSSLYHPLRLFLILLSASLLPSALAQTVAPTNSFTPNPSSAGITIQIGLGLYSYHSYLQPLVPAASPRDSQPLRGPLYRAGASNTSSLDTTSIVFITCDLHAYDNTFLNATDTIANAVLRTPLAIVLYSDITSGCSFTPGSRIPDTYKNLFSLTSSTGNGTMIELTDSTTVLIQRRSLFDGNNSTSNPNGGSPNGPSGPSPSTAVAMIILYSITGVITALFLVIIVTGAVRAHRHPERYGPRNAHGRPRQSRARGLARAMLDTLPIVKFGEKEEDKTPDTEMAAAQSAANAPTNEAGGVVSQEAKDIVPEGGESQAVAGAEKGEQSTSKDPQISPTPSPVQQENQGCSICTDDFEIGQDVRVLPCSHSFHPACIDPWLLNVSGTCPLCRIDLRPKTARTQDNLLSSERAERSEGASSTIPEDEVFPPPLDPGAEVSRRASRRHSLIWDLLNPSRMRDATPQERIEALRRVREQRQMSAAEEAEARRRRRISVRLQDVFSIRTATRNQEPSVAEVAEESAAPEAGRSVN